MLELVLHGPKRATAAAVWWVDAHLRYLRRTCPRLGVEVDERLELVYERFDVVWQPAVSD